MAENTEDRVKITWEKFLFNLNSKVVQHVQVISPLFWNHILFQSILIQIFLKGIKVIENSFSISNFLL